MKKFTNLLKDEKIMRQLQGFFVNRDERPIKDATIVIVFLLDVAYIMNISITGESKGKGWVKRDMPFRAEGYNCDIDGDFVPYTRKVDKVDNLLCHILSERNPELSKEEIIKIADSKINTIEFTDEDYKEIIDFDNQLQKLDSKTK